MCAILHGAEALRAAPCALGTPCIIKPVDQISRKCCRHMVGLVSLERKVPDVYEAVLRN